jgi:hypothetical protein
MPVPFSFETAFAKGRTAPEVTLRGMMGFQSRPFSPVYQWHQTALNGRRDICISHGVYASNRETRRCSAPCEILLTAHFPVMALGTPT